MLHGKVRVVSAAGSLLNQSQDNWIRLKEALEQRLSPQVCATWISQMNCTTDDGQTLRIGLPDAFSLNWVKDHYRHVIEDELVKIGPIALDFVLCDPPPIDPAIPTPREETPLPTSHPANDDLRLNSRYVFPNFVKGPSNELAWTAAKTVADSRMTAYNPLVIVGGVGLGKTHLLHAIGHVAKKRRPPCKIRLKTSEQFVNDVLVGIQQHRMEQVRQMYRACDILLIDDIQFISGKSHCQEEFFHTFNALYDAEKQIVVTSDRMPHEIPDLEERVKSRFAWGLIADLKLPQLETRFAIVLKKAEAEGIDLDESVATFLAQSVRSNMRELEGCLIRVNAIAGLRKVPITVALAREVLKGIISEKAQALTCEAIVKAVAAHFDVKVADLKSTKRARSIAFPRQISMYLCRQHTSSSYPDIGQALGGKDHTTALNAMKRITERLADPDVRAHVEEIERQLLD